MQSIKFDIDPGIQAAWVSEAKKRKDEVRNETIEPIPDEETLTQVKQLLDE